MGRPVSQQAFDALVKENMEDLGMDANEALEDAVQTLTLQGADLSGIIKRSPGEEHPVIRALDDLRSIGCSGANTDEMVAAIEQLIEMCSEADENVAIASRNGGVELLCSLCAKLEDKACLVSALRALAFLIKDLQSTEAFRGSNGSRIVLEILTGNRKDLELLDSCFSVVAAAATGNEVVKESLMELKVDEQMVQAMKEHPRGSVPSLYEALQILLAQDDNRVLASQVYGYARRFAEIGAVDTLVDALHDGISSTCLISACMALKAVAVNDEICISVSEKGGIDAILKCIDDSGHLNNKEAAKICCSLLSKLARSDANKKAIVQKKGLERLINLSSRFSDDPSVIQEVMSIIAVLSLRSPENAAHAVEAGAGELATQAMQKFPSAYQMQRQSCLMIRNLVVRNPENRSILLSSGIEKIIRKAKVSHDSCKDAATDALRDLGVDNYNA